MKTATITEAENGLSALIALVRAGESVTTTDRRRPVAILDRSDLLRTGRAGSNVSSGAA